MSRSKKTSKAPALRRSTRLKKQAPPPPLPIAVPNRLGRRLPTASTSKAPEVQDEQDESTDHESDTEVDELAEDTSLLDVASKNPFHQLLGMLGDETIQDVLGSEGYEDEDTDVSSQEHDEGDDRTGSVINIESSNDGSSFYIIPDDHDHVSTPQRKPKTERGTYKSFTALSPFPSSSPAASPAPKSNPKRKADDRTGSAEPTPKQKRDEESPKPQSKKARKTSAKQPKKRGRKPKLEKADESEVEEEPSEEVLEEMLDYFILHIPVGDPDDKQDRVTKAVQIEFKTPYKIFLYQVAEAMSLAVDSIPRLSYKFSLTRTAIEMLLCHETDYDQMLATLKEKAKAERDRAVHERVLVSNGGKKGPKQSKSVSKAKQTQQPCEVYLCRKVVAAPKEAKKKGSGGGQASTWSAAMTKPQKPTMSVCINQIKELNVCQWPHCDNAGGFCREIRDPINGGLTHRALTSQNIELWANMVVQGTAEFHHPPSCIRLYDNKTAQRQKQVAQPSAPGPQHPHPPPTYSASTSANMGVGGMSGNQPQYPSLAQPPAVPELAEWLAECDATGRGAPAIDNFSSMIPGFEMAGFVLLTDLRGFTWEQLLSLGLRKADGSELKILPGTAWRLLQNVGTDLEIFDETVLAFASKKKYY
ncbi:hypothetical protein FRC09_002254 [Ceratobasidium sp. 395]|nr:hypothetical protein FRC09_002254 [Ceratobasidium sp. 395]